MHARRRRARESHGWLITAAVEQGRSRATVLLGSSLVPSPVVVVVLVSRLLFDRRCARSEGAARGGRRTTRARRAQRTCIAGG